MLVVALIAMFLLFFLFQYADQNPRSFVGSLGLHELDSWQKILTAGGIITVAGAIVSLVISFRRQRDVEETSFSNAFARAAEQLGGPSAPIRMAGVYTIAALADANPSHRQQCIDVLCGYIRLPYNVSTNVSGLVGRAYTNSDYEDDSLVETYEYIPGEKEVRLTILRVIRDRLNLETKPNWNGFDFDFTGAVFDAGEFNGSDFTGVTMNFNRARFQSGDFSFNQVRFNESRITFNNVELVNANLTFAGSTITKDSELSFDEMTLTADTALDFTGLKILKGKISLLDLKMRGGVIKHSDSIFKRPDLEELQKYLYNQQS